MVATRATTIEPGQGMQIHLSKPGGQKEGPFTVDQINHDLAAGRYNESDYWAWYQGLESWIPLHAVPGVKAIAAPAAEITRRGDEEQYSIATQFMAAPESSETATAVDVAEQELEAEPDQSLQ